jgi:hypothetical protein
MRRITIGFSIHRPEIVDMTSDFIRGHEAIFLEEPPQFGFQRMLDGTLSIEEYLLPIDIEYPEFSRRMCRLLQRFHAAGVKIIQIEPFLEHLLAVHEFFSRGQRPDNLERNSIRYRVYCAERDATSALLDYYKTVTNGSFEEVVDSIIRFARTDAARFRLRDSLRASQLSDRITRYESSFIEAGSIHYGLYRELKRRMATKIRIKPMFIAHKAMATLGVRGHLYGPGDQLTLRYIIHSGIKDAQLETLLAARSLIYSKLIEKEEQTTGLTSFPHIRNELGCIRMVKLLTIDDCSRLFALVRRVQTSHAREIVVDYLKRFKKRAA